MRKTATELIPGESVHDEAQPQRARYVHSVTEAEHGLLRINFGHPGGDPDDPENDDDGNDLGLVPADKEYEIVADANGNRPSDGDLPTLMDAVRSITEDAHLSADDRLGRIRDVLGSLDQARDA
jgi:hypothetical protein